MPLNQRDRQRTVPGDTAFDALWRRLLERAKNKPEWRTQTITGKAYYLTAGADRIVLKPVAGGKSRRPYKREEAEKLWSSGLRKDPKNTTLADVAKARGNETHRSYWWVIYGELWDLAHASKAA